MGGWGWKVGLLTKLFTLEELDTTVKEIKNNTALGSDGMFIEFFKEFWPRIRMNIMEMLDDLHQWKLDLSTDNFDP
jgi:hypothetical protein